MKEGLDMKHAKIIFITIVFLSVIGIIAITYAKWSVKSEQIDLNTLTVGCLETSIVEGEAISMTNLYPVTDNEGIESVPYTFSLKNTCSEKQKVQINLELFATNASYDPSQIKFSFNGSNPAYINSLTTMNPILTNATSGYILTTDTIAGGVTHEYDLKMWIDENVTIENGTNKIFKTRVSIITTYGK